MRIAFFLTLIPLAFIMAIPILIGVYVYKDSTARGMNAALWTLVVVLAPALVGFIIYLLVRRNDLRCPNCSSAVTDQYVVCPKCGARLKLSCPSCGSPTESDWKSCPNCAATLPEHDENFAQPVKRSDKALGKILAAVIIMPIFLLVSIGILSFSSHSYSSSMSTTYLSASDYSNQPEITAWINKCNENPDMVYALSYKEEYDDRKVTHYLVYRPSSNPTEFASNPTIQSDFDAVSTTGLFNMAIEVRLTESQFGPTDEKLICISNYSNKHARLKVFVNGKRVDCEITEVNFNPVM